MGVEAARRAAIRTTRREATACLGPRKLGSISSLSVSFMASARAVLDVAAAIIERDGTFFACRRNSDRAFGGLWEFPGGKLEPGETPPDALVREIREELGVEISVLGELTTDETSFAGLTIRLHCYRARLVDSAPHGSSDHDALRWLRPDELGGLKWAPADYPAVHALTKVEPRGVTP